MDLQQMGRRRIGRWKLVNKIDGPRIDPIERSLFDVMSGVLVWRVLVQRPFDNVRVECDRYTTQGNAFGLKSFDVGGNGTCPDNLRVVDLQSQLPRPSFLVDCIIHSCDLDIRLGRRQLSSLIPRHGRQGDLVRC